MSLTELQIHHLRNLTNIRLSFHPFCNFIYGGNGSGKSSIMEAIYLLGTGHSFRTREISPLIQYNMDSLTLFSRTSNDGCISIQKSKHQPTTIKINQSPCFSTSELARILPCQIFHQDIFHIIDTGPTVRRNLIDWGLFHVKQEYLVLLKNYNRVLKQRNYLLRKKANRNELLPWDEQLCSFAEQLNDERTEYFNVWGKYFHELLPMLTSCECEISYFKGWDRKQLGKSLMDTLNHQFDSDLHKQYTQSGAHHADIIFSNVKAKQHYSRGQQKIILITLKIAQANLLNKPCIFLFDDLPSEFDDTHLSKLLAYLPNLNGQIFISSTNNLLYSQLPNSKIFHLANGQIVE